MLRESGERLLVPRFVGPNPTGPTNVLVERELRDQSVQESFQDEFFDLVV
jgi:hypothetical protein